jgi:predicted ferric reductase
MNYKLKKISLLGLILISYVVVLISINYPPSFRLQTLASIFGLLGAMLLWWQFMLGARGVVAKFIPDVIWINQIHKLAGQYGYLQILWHPVLMVISYGMPLDFWLRFASPFDFYAKLGSLAFTLLTFTWIVSGFMRKRLSYRWWKRLHFLNYAIVPLVLTHSLNIGSLIFSSPILRGFWLFLIASFWVAVAYRIAYQFGLGKAKYQLVAKTVITPDITRYDLSHVGGFILHPQPGQFLYLQTKPWGESHPFTISHFDPATGNLSLSIKASGDFSRSLTNLDLGHELLIDGPFGVFTNQIPQINKPIILIAGGIGITPYIANLNRLKTLSTPPTIFFANKTAADIAYKQELDLLNTIHVLSAETVVGLETGFVSKDLLLKYLNQPLNTYAYFITGPKPMMDAIKKTLILEAVNPSDISIEEFSL